MMKRTRLVVATATLATLAATGTAAAAGPAPTPGDAKSDSATVKVDRTSKGAADAELAAIAAKLGVTTDRLTAALMAAKTSLANSTGITPDAFAAAVANNLGLPIPQVQDALQPMVAEPAPAGDNQGKPDGMDKKGMDGPQKPPDGKSKGAADAELAAIAAKLGVTTDRLTAALMAAKTSLANSAGITPDAFAAAVADNLGLPIPQVQDALQPTVAEPAPAGDNQGKLDGMDKKGVDGPQNSPFTTDAAAASVAAALGVDQAKAKAALAAVVALGSDSGRVDPTSTAFGDIAASLGVTSDQLNTALSDLKRSLSGG
ncbi:hypothetical protein JOL79_14570 [Microbispora sp. RL4-1S]|uniref:Uncharacterized protein n=1 Tax=Microbispora oryzae TaxID=2806554 RepID=A0A940WKM1_9ACTN|nr:hypothetical protein [Microbispora oryzae]MBP2705037.1 hypothetical protein [Microbispora oryzae]